MTTRQPVNPRTQRPKPELRIKVDQTFEEFIASVTDEQRGIVQRAYRQVYERRLDRQSTAAESKTA